jgi:hypothetical protein
MTKLEMQALLLATELESNIRSGATYTTNIILALNQFRIAQQESEVQLGADLENMYRQHLELVLLDNIKSLNTESN